MIICGIILGRDSCYRLKLLEPEISLLFVKLDNTFLQLCYLETNLCIEFVERLLVFELNQFLQLLLHFLFQKELFLFLCMAFFFCKVLFKTLKHIYLVIINKFNPEGNNLLVSTSLFKNISQLLKKQSTYVLFIVVFCICDYSNRCDFIISFSNPFKMSYKAIFELILSLENYKIIEYPFQGVFSFQVRLYQQKNSRRVGICQNQYYSIPYEIIKMPNLQQKARIIGKGDIGDQCYESSRGIAKYSDQLIEMGDCVQIRLELEAFPQLETDHIYLEIEFFFCKNMSLVSQSKPESVEKLRFKISQLQNGLFSYCSCNFKQPYLSSLNIIMFGMLSSFKFAKYEPPKSKQSIQQRKRANITSFEGLLQYAQSVYGKKEMEGLFYVNYVKKLRLCQYLTQEKIIASTETQQKVPIMRIDNKEMDESHFREYLDKYEPQTFQINSFLKEINQIREQNFDLLQSVIKHFQEQTLQYEQISEIYREFLREKYGERVFKSIVSEDEGEKANYKENKKIAKEIRQKNIKLNYHPIEDEKFMLNREDEELIFYEITSRAQPKLPQQKQKIIYNERFLLVVLCHGYQGSSYDMQLIKRWIKEQLPDAHYLTSKHNQDDTDGNIEDMGKKLSEEVRAYVKNYLDEDEQDNLILNFVGHSMGGIIARSSLIHLSQYSHRLGFFCSLSSPHLGYLNGVSNLIKVGLWALRRWKSITSLEQLSMEESDKHRDTFLFKLSKEGHLKNFRKIILLSSFEDNYVSWHSARISAHHKLNNKLSKLENEMVENILGDNVYGCSIHRLDINFNIRGNSIDNFIGRKAHINLIVQDSLFEVINLTLPKLFFLREFYPERMFM